MADDRRWETGSAHPDRRGEDEGFRLSGRQIGAGIVALLLVVFVLQNTDTTSVTLLVFDVSFPLWLVLAGTILLSLGVGYVLGSRGRSRRKKEAR
jgi:uncharacterized integral membrane protein